MASELFVRLQDPKEVATSEFEWEFKKFARLLRVYDPYRMYNPAGRIKETIGTNEINFLADQLVAQLLDILEGR